jgi:hypothetical protein
MRPEEINLDPPASKVAESTPDPAPAKPDASAAAQRLINRLKSK